MKKLCLLCNTLDESGAATCVMCGEATWSPVEELPVEEPAPADEPAAPVKKRGRK